MREGLRSRAQSKSGGGQSVRRENKGDEQGDEKAWRKTHSTGNAGLQLDREHRVQEMRRGENDKQTVRGREARSIADSAQESKRARTKTVKWTPEMPFTIAKRKQRRVITIAKAACSSNRSEMTEPQWCTEPTGMN